MQMSEREIRDRHFRKGVAKQTLAELNACSLAEIEKILKKEEGEPMEERMKALKEVKAQKKPAKAKKDELLDKTTQETILNQMQQEPIKPDNSQYEALPEVVKISLYTRISELDDEIKEKTRQYRELVNFVQGRR